MTDRSGHSADIEHDFVPLSYPSRILNAALCESESTGYHADARAQGTRIAWTTEPASNRIDLENIYPPSFCISRLSDRRRLPVTPTGLAIHHMLRGWERIGTDVSDYPVWTKHADQPLCDSARRNSAVRHHGWNQARGGREFVPQLRGLQCSQPQHRKLSQ